MMRQLKFSKLFKWAIRRETPKIDMQDHGELSTTTIVRVRERVASFNDGLRYSLAPCESKGIRENYVRHGWT